MGQQLDIDGFFRNQTWLAGKSPNYGYLMGNSSNYRK
jgi:hypothetical protein